jgi:transcription elongation factor Elf1
MGGKAHKFDERKNTEIFKMILRQPIRCTVCGHRYILRISVGSGKTQEHSIICSECHQKLSMYFEKNYKNASFAGHKFENCEPSDEDIGDVINLHPDFVIPEDQVNNPMYFANIHAIQKLEKTGIFSKLISTDPSKYYSGNICV